MKTITVALLIFLYTSFVALGFLLYSDDISGMAAEEYMSKGAQRPRSQSQMMKKVLDPGPKKQQTKIKQPKIKKKKFGKATYGDAYTASSSAEARKQSRSSLFRSEVKYDDRSRGGRSKRSRFLEQSAGSYKRIEPEKAPVIAEQTFNEEQPIAINQQVIQPSTEPTTNSGSESFKQQSDDLLSLLGIG